MKKAWDRDEMFKPFLVDIKVNIEIFYIHVNVNMNRREKGKEKYGEGFPFTQITDHGTQNTDTPLLIYFHK